MRRGLTVLAAVAALALAGCGSEEDGGGVASANGGGTTEDTGAAEPGLSRQEMGVKFAQCMRENGVPMDDPEPGKGVQLKLDGSVPRETVDAAMEACREYSPQQNGGGDPRMEERSRVFAQCMRDNGVEEFPDPEPGQGGIRIDRGVAQDPDFDAAQRTCQEVLAGPGAEGGA
ncbi:hypothetical protein [Actinophytocola gossypii]|uniref:Secreted protein n=1 Tax=Actinophytocola gossypii TaxID=2812003 RepID=A0ABT2JCH2_9PSEU|nr:hypothetical protein [Actinophytocola gossypii]MCT2585416.1 hypothetical protein [Actinophytocola gossypii]